jgi:phosphoglycolate phosphatase-like HAD superfamily hydrolase
MHDIQMVVFEMAGTTVHDEDGVNRWIREALEAVGIAADPVDVNRVMGLPKTETIAILIERDGRADDLGDRVEEIYRDFVRRALALYATDPSVREVPGASEVFDRLRAAEIRVALNTGFSREITDVILERLGWRHDRER